MCCDFPRWQQVEIVALGDGRVFVALGAGLWRECRIAGFAGEPVDNPGDNRAGAAAASEKASEIKTGVLIQTASEIQTLLPSSDVARERRRARNRRHYLRRRAGLCGARARSHRVSEAAHCQTPIKTYAREEEGRGDLFPPERPARQPGEAAAPQGRARQVLMDQAFAFIRRRRLLREAEIAALLEQITEGGRWERYLARGTGAFPAPLREFFEHLFPQVQRARTEERAGNASSARSAGIGGGIDRRQRHLPLPIAGGNARPRHGPDNAIIDREAG